MTLPNLAGVATKDLVEKIGSGQVQRGIHQLVPHPQPAPHSCPWLDC